MSCTCVTMHKRHGDTRGTSYQPHAVACNIDVACAVTSVAVPSQVRRIARRPARIPTYVKWREGGRGCCLWQPSSAEWRLCTTSLSTGDLLLCFEHIAHTMLGALGI